MTFDLNGFNLRLSLLAAIDGDWFRLPLQDSLDAYAVSHKGLQAALTLERSADRIAYTLQFSSPWRTRLRLMLELFDRADYFHLIPGNIHGNNNAAHVQPGQFPVLATDRRHERDRAALWEFRADRASHPVSILCCDKGVVGVSIDPYSPCTESEDGFIRNGVFAAVPNAFGVSLGYGNDPMTFRQKTDFIPATADFSHGATARGHVFALPGDRRGVHQIIRSLHGQFRDIPQHARTPVEGLRALADAFVFVNWSDDLQQYTNRKCQVPVDTVMQPWRAIVEIGWTGGSMLAYPFALAEQIFADLRMPKSSAQIFDEICSGYNAASGFINDAAINRTTRIRPAGWNESEINGWWSGFLPNTRGNHCAYTNAHAAYYLLRTLAVQPERIDPTRTAIWADTAIRVLDTAVSLQRDDGAFGYIFSSTERKVIDWEGFAGCWFAAALPYAWQRTGEQRYLDSADRAMRFYAPFVGGLAAWGSPMDTYKSVDSEGNLAFIRAARLLHEFTGRAEYLQMLLDGAHYEYLWRYGFRTRPQAPPLKGSGWNSCGGTITSVSNPHIHPMGVVATDDLQYLARVTGDRYHADRAEDGIAWLMNTMELYPDVTGYGRYGVLSERTCPSDGLLAERFYDDNSPASTWWSYNAWAAGSAMEALAELVRNHGAKSTR